MHFSYTQNDRIDQKTTILMHNAREVHISHGVLLVGITSNLRELISVRNARLRTSFDAPRDLEKLRTVSF